MPSLDNIEQFKARVYSIADEPAHRAEAGLSPELDIAPPESPLGEEDLSALLSPPEMEDSPVNLEDLALGLDTAPEQEPESEEAPGMDDLLGGLFDDQESFPVPAEEELPVEELGESEALLEGFAEELTAPEGEDITTLGGGFGDDFAPVSGVGGDFGSDSLDNNFYSADSPAGDSIVFDDLPQAGSDFDFGGESDFSDEFSELVGMATTEEEVESYDTSADADEFALGDIGTQFGLTPDETPGEPEVLNPAENIDQEIAQSKRTLVLSDDEFKVFQKALAGFPLNLKLAVEEIIGEKEPSFEDLSKLIRMLINGASVKSVATLAGRILGKTIKIPPGFMKGSGEAHENNLASFPYLVQKYMWPVLRGFLAGTVAAAVLLLLGFNYLYTPWKADSLYKEGLQDILTGDSPAGDGKFNDAWRRWASEEWVFRYADAHAAMGEYDRAQKKYQVFLQETLAEDPVTGQIRTYYLNYHKKALLAYHKLLADFGYDGLDRTGHLKKAEALLEPIFQRDHKDKEGLLARGDLYARWGEVEGSRIQDAMNTYSLYSEYHGDDNQIAWRRLKVFLSMDEEKPILTFRNALRYNTSLSIPSEVVAELAAWLIDREAERRISQSSSEEKMKTLGEELNPFLTAPALESTGVNYLEGVKEILFKAQEQSPALPDVHYQLARYFRLQDTQVDEEKALGAADYYFQVMDPVAARSKARTIQRIDTLNRIGEVFFRKKETQQAAKYFLEARRLYEDALTHRVVTPRSEFGRIYSNLGDIYYTTGIQDWPVAGQLYAQAETHGYAPPEQLYKMAVVHYSQGEFSQALDRFYSTENSPGLKANRNILFSMGNTLFKTGNYPGAMGYYQELAKDLGRTEPVMKAMAILDETREEISLDQVNRTSLAEALAEMEANDKVYLSMMVKLWNNMGLSVLRSKGARRQDSLGYQEAAVYLSRARILDDALGRREEELVAGKDSLIGINVRNMVGTWNPEDLEIYADLPRTLQARWE